jgi:hypothetical protein
MKVILKYNNTCRGSFLPRFSEIVSAVLRKLKMHENATSSNNNRRAAIFELNLHPFMIHLYTKYNLNPSNHQ